MQLFILRHGQAEIQKTTDEVRNLTLTGRHEVSATVLRSLQDLQTVQQVWVSPLVRAQQTAKIACDILTQHAVTFSVRTTELLIPEAKPSLLFDALQSVQVESILWVSHQPLVGQFIDLFCDTYPGFHEMNTSSLACIDYQIAAAKLGALRWLRHANV